jgi:hypothetical protein
VPGRFSGDTPKGLPGRVVEKKYTYFISSTFVDLEKERQAVINYIMEMEEIPIGMESFGAVDRPPWEHIQKLIDTADYYILIIAGKYGSIYTGDELGLSFTHKEYRYAVEKGIPVIAIIHEQPGKISREFSETDPDRIKLLEAFKAEVKAVRLTTRYVTTDDILRRLGVAVPKAKRELPRPGWVRNEGHILDEDTQRAFLRFGHEMATLQSEHEKEVARLKAKIAELENRRPDYAAAFGRTSNLDEPGQIETADYNGLRRQNFLNSLVIMDITQSRRGVKSRKSIEISRGDLFVIVADQIVNGKFSRTHDTDTVYLDMTKNAFYKSISPEFHDATVILPAFGPFDLVIELFGKIGFLTEEDGHLSLTIDGAAYYDDHRF